MAITISQAEAVSRPFFSEVFTENVYRRCAALQLLNEHERIQDGGEYAVFPIDVTEAGTAEAQGAREQVVIRDEETITAVRSEWKYYRGSTMIWPDEAVKNTGNAAIIKLMRKKADIAQKSLATKMGRDIYTRNPNGKGMQDLTTIIGTGALGGVNEKLFRSKVINVAALKMYGDSDDSLSGLINESLFDTEHCTHMLLAPTMKSKIEAVWVKEAGRFQMTQSNRLVELGLKTFRFMDVDFVSDQFLSESETLRSSLFGIDIEALEFYRSSEGSSNGTWKDAEPLGYPDGLFRIPRWVGELTATRRRTMFRVEGVASVEFGL